MLDPTRGAVLLRQHEMGQAAASAMSVSGDRRVMVAGWDGTVSVRGLP